MSIPQRLETCVNTVIALAPQDHNQAPDTAPAGQQNGVALTPYSMSTKIDSFPLNATLKPANPVSEGTDNESSFVQSTPVPGTLCSKLPAAYLHIGLNGLVNLFSFLDTAFEEVVQ